MASDPGIAMQNGDGGNGHIADDGGMHAAAAPAHDSGKSPGILGRFGAEFLGAIGFVSMFTAIGGAVAPMIIGDLAVATAVPLALGALTLGVTAMIGAAIIRKHNDDKKAAMPPSSPEKKHPNTSDC